MAWSEAADLNRQAQERNADDRRERLEAFHEVREPGEKYADADTWDVAEHRRNQRGHRRSAL